MRLLFLDIDGVLNTQKNYDWGKGPVELIDKKLAQRLNRLINNTYCKLVITSTWRVNVLSGALSLAGFQFLLRTHGIRGEVAGVTKADYDCPIRGRQIADYLENHRPASYVILDDDMNEQLTTIHPTRVVFTDGNYGLSEDEVNRAIDILGREVSDDEFNSVLERYRSFDCSAYYYAK